MHSTYINWEEQFIQRENVKFFGPPRLGYNGYKTNAKTKMRKQNNLVPLNIFIRIKPRSIFMTTIEQFLHEEGAEEPRL
jgi:hypothetical protein